MRLCFPFLLLLLLEAISFLGRSLPVRAEAALTGAGRVSTMDGREARVRRFRQPAINVWEAVRYMAPGVMAHKSAERDGEVLEMPDWGDAPD